MQEGMWVVELKPKPSGGSIAYVDLTVQSFSDRLVDNDEGTASERFRDRLRATEPFGEKTEIVSERAVGTGDYLRRFKINLELDPPLAVK